MKKATLLFIIIVLILAGIGGMFAYKKIFPPVKIHYHAGFVVFENNKKLDFSGSNYMYIKPCVANGKEEEEEPQNEQMEKAHLHDGVGDVVHIEARGAVWQDLFTNIRYPINYTKATGYLNNKNVIDFQKLPIRALDSLVVFIGDNDPKYLNESVTRDYIETQAKKSTTCGD